MKVKKILLPLALSLSVLGLVSCGATKKTSVTPEPNTPVTPDPVNPSDPTNPSTPTDPSNPSTPTDPTNPVTPDPVNPVDPVVYPDDEVVDYDKQECMNAGSGAKISEGNVKIVECSGMEESAYVEFEKVSSYDEYNVYIAEKGTNEYKKLTNNFDYCISNAGSNLRLDISGLKKGSYDIKIAASKDGNDMLTSSVVRANVVAYDRSGYAHYKYDRGVGAYNNDGTLKDNAIVLYVTDENKNTIELSYKGTTVKGIGNILNSSGQETTEAGHAGECKRTSDGHVYYGKANSNQGIIKKLADDGIPLVVRLVGCVSSSGLYEKGAFDAGQAPLIEGLTYFNSWDYGGTYKSSDGDQGHMARMQSGKDITIEGVGEEPTADGWGFHFICQSSNPELGESFEVRNIKFINTPEDAIGMEGEATSKLITAPVEHCWIHNNEFYHPNITRTTDNDKSNGDGSVDFKRGMYFTCSYNYYEGCHKTNLVGSSDSSLQFNLTYHHNYYYMCDARGPLTRQANVHMYNNFFFGQISYAMNTRANAYIFSEYNEFYMCKQPYRVDAGAIKSYKDSLVTVIENSGGSNATFVTNKNETVSNACAYNGTALGAFDTDESLSYIPSNNYELQTDVTLARKVIFAKAGVIKSAQVKAREASLSDVNVLKDVLPNVTVNKPSVPSTVTPGKVSKTVYAFKIEKAATVNITYADAGVLCNEAGVAILRGNGVATLNPGTYYIQPASFQPGEVTTTKITQGTFKECTINSIEFTEYDSTEYMQELLTAYNTAFSNLPSDITYTDACYNKIKACMNAYEALGEYKNKVTNYQTVTNAFNTYKSLGEAYVVNVINAIGTVNANSGSAITTARSEYNKLISKASNASVSNYQTLVDAENAFKSFAVDACISAINAIGNVTLDSKNLIEQAETIYNSLDSTQTSLVTNYSTLTAARTKYDMLVKINELQGYINQSKYEEFTEEYILLTSDAKALAKEIIGENTIDQAIASYTIAVINTLPATITAANGTTIVKAEELYAMVNTKSLVTNYEKLTAARAAYNVILESAMDCTFTVSGSNLSISNTTSFHWAQTPAASSKSATINGKSYSGGLKMNSKGVFTFNTTSSKTITIYATNASTIKIDGVEVSIVNGIATKTLEAGSHTVEKGDAEACVFYVSVA